MTDVFLVSDLKDGPVIFACAYGRYGGLDVELDPAAVVAIEPRVHRTSHVPPRS